MPRDSDLYDFFVSYARRDNVHGWINGFIEQLLAEHRKFSGGRELTYFFDRRDISSLSDWREQIYNQGLARSRLFLAFVSPGYFASEWCCREWRAWIDLEIAKHILTAGAAPIYIVEVPGFMSSPPLGEHKVAEQVARLCGIPPPHERLVEQASPVVRQLRNRQLTAVQPFYNEGLEALRRADLHTVLERLARDLDQRAQDVRLAAESETTIPPYNRRFSGRLEELVTVREQLKDDRAGVISGIHGLGGIGKTELAFTYAHAFASAYPAGRFLIECEGQSRLAAAMIGTGSFTALFREAISDEDRKRPESYFAALGGCLRERLDRLGHGLLVLDNVTDAALLRRQQIDQLTALGPKLHLLATTRLPPSGQGHWLTLGELKPDEALELLEKHRTFADESEREAARSIVRRLGGFALAVELVAAWLMVHESATYAGLSKGLGLEDLETFAGDADPRIDLRHNERRLHAVLMPTLATLQSAEQRAMEYASLLPPDLLPLPWLKELVTADFPELTRPGRFGDPWVELCRRIERLALFIRVEEESTAFRLVRVHRLVQDLQNQVTTSKGVMPLRKHAVQSLARRRAFVVSNDWGMPKIEWELEPLLQLSQMMRGWIERDVAVTAGALANPLMQTGQYDAAAERLAEGASIFEALCLQDPSNDQHQYERAVTLRTLGDLQQQVGDFDAALSSFQTASAVLSELHSAGGEFAAHSASNLTYLVRGCGDIEKERGHVAEARIQYARALHVSKQYVQQSPSSLTALWDLAASIQRLWCLSWDTGDRDDAEVQWNELESVMRELAQRAPPDPNLAAEFCRVMVIRGDQIKSTDPATALRLFRLAETELAKLLEIAPRHTTFRRDLNQIRSRIAGIAGNTSKSGTPTTPQSILDESAKLAELHPENVVFLRDHLVALDREGAALFDKGLTHEAELTLSQALSLCDKLLARTRTPRLLHDRVLTLFKLAKCSVSNGDTEIARSRLGNVIGALAEFTEAGGELDDQLAEMSLHVFVMVQGLPQME